MKEPLSFLEPFRLATPEGWTVHPGLNRITGPDGEHQLEPRLMRLLLCLVAARGEPVSREALLDAVWGDTFVAEGSLTLAISELRRMLGDDPKAPRYIETVRKVGYRWLAPLRPLPEESPTTAPPMRRHRLRTLLPVAVGSAGVTLLAAVAVLAAWWPGVPPAPASSARSFAIPRPETSAPGMEVGPSLSPDGRQLAFAQWQLPEVRYRILLKHRDTATAVDLPGEADFEDSPTWSPQGDRLAFVRCTGNDCGIFIQSLPGGDPRWLADLHFPTPSALAWLPDGRSLVFADRRVEGGSVRLYRVGLEEGVVHPLTRAAEGVRDDLYPRVSPDGRRAVFARGDRAVGTEAGLFGVSGHLLAMDLVSGEITRLTSEAAEIFGVAWIPQGEGLVYTVRAEEMRWELRRLELGEGRDSVEVLLRREGVLRNPVVSRQGEVILEVWWGDRNLWRVDLPSGEAVRLFHSTRQDAEPSLSPDRSRMAFVSTRSGHQEVWLADLRTGGVHPLTEFGGPPLSYPRWSPDGRSLAFLVRTPKGSELYRLAVDPPGAARRLLAWPGAAMVSSWSRDGRWIYVGSDHSGRWQVWRVAADTGAAERVMPEDGVAAVEMGEAPDGGIRLLFTRPGQCGIWETVLGQEGSGEARLLLPGLGRDDHENWGVVDAGVYYLRRDPETSESLLHLWDPATGQDTTLATLPWLPTTATTLTLSDDGSELLYSRLEDLNADLVSVPLEATLSRP